MSSIASQPDLDRRIARVGLAQQDQRQLALLLIVGCRTGG
jgi:hypothetical protein